LLAWNTAKHNDCNLSTYFVVNRHITNKSLYACMHAACSMPPVHGAM